jgi:hypothetical protein
MMPNWENERRPIGASSEAPPGQHEKARGAPIRTQMPMRGTVDLPSPAR